MNSFLSIYKVQTGVATPITIPDPIISYNFATTDVSGGNVRNTIDGTYDLNLKNGALVVSGDGLPAGCLDYTLPDEA